MHGQVVGKAVGDIRDRFDDARGSEACAFPAVGIDVENGSLDGIGHSRIENRASDEIVNGIISPNLTTTVINRNLALVGASGEFFCTHAKRLRRLSPMKTIFFGYCNGHHLYFPTIEASIEGGQGARIFESWVPVGTGERMIFEALLNIFFWDAIG